MPAVTDSFYTQLTTHQLSLGELLSREQLFEPVPADWHIIITDITDSTKAVRDGLHENVNLIATGSIVVVLNLAFKQQLSVPFFFGGDGATFIVPPFVLDKAMQALLQYRENVRKDFNLQLRVGSLPVATVYGQGHHLRISKFNISEYFPIPVVLGNGLNAAEKIIKGEDYLFEDAGSPEEPDLSGMQCRWDKIAPPQQSHEIVTLLVIATKESHQADAFRKVIHLIDAIYGNTEERQPISVAKLKLKTTFGKLSTEMRARIGKIRFLELFRNWVIGLIGYFYLRTRKGRHYLDTLVKMSDTLVIDGKINTVISGTAAQRDRLRTALDRLEADGTIVYGLHVSGESVMSCYVRDLKDDHIHFVDGSEGGYTKAATMLKGKLAV